MTSQRLPSGCWAVLPTPFTGPELRICEPSVDALARHYRAVGAVGLTVLGVFGEAAALSPAERSQMVELVAAASTGLPLVVGLSGGTTADAIEEAESALAAADSALAGVMVKIGTADLSTFARHIRALYEATNVSVVIQDYPTATGVHVDARELAALVRDQGDIVAGVKAEAEPTAAAINVLTTKTDTPVFGGLGGVGLLDELACGAAGSMTGFSFFEGLVSTHAAYRRSGFAAARAVLSPWLPLANFEAQKGIGLAVRKELLLQRGLMTSAAVRPPAAELPQYLRWLVQEHASEAGRLLAKGAHE